MSISDSGHPGDTSQAVAVLDAAGRHRTLSYAYAQLFGYDATSRLAGRRWDRLYTVSGRETLLEEARPAIQRGEAWTGLVGAVLADGTRRTFEVALNPLSDGFIACLVNEPAVESTEDYEQAQVEALAAEFAVTFISLKPGEIDAAILAALEQAATALKAERAALFRFVEDGMVVRPAHTWMATGEREMGGEEFPVTLMPWLKRQLEAGRLLAVSSRADLPEEASRELAQMERDGVQSFVAAPLRYAGALIGYLRFDLMAADAMMSSPQASLVERTAQIFANVLERKRMENQLIASKEAAEEAARIKSSFLANMSHEIRTPLTSIIGFAGLLAEEVETEQEQEYVSLIQDSGTRLMETLNSVLDLAQLEAAGRSVNLSVFDLNQQVEDVVRLLRPLADAKGLTLEAVPSEMPARAEVDHACLLRILNNLIGNAIKFTSKGGVSVEVVADGQQVSIHVRDTGIGIDEAFLPRLFDPFRQESGGLNRQYEGSGLGLTISKRLIDLMGGTIEVTSEKSVGSTFTISFAQVRP
ncbi:MAG: ATP-binding protein, partial [Bacteroidota bacterium]